MFFEVARSMFSRCDQTKLEHDFVLSHHNAYLPDSSSVLYFRKENFFDLKQPLEPELGESCTLYGSFVALIL